VIGTNSEEAFFTPIGSPRITDDPIPLTSASDPILISDLSETYKDYTMVDLSIAIRALQKILSKYTLMIS
jgi:hypothetical protein